MKSKKLIIKTLILFIVFFVVGWKINLAILSFVEKAYLSIGSVSYFSVNEMNAQLKVMVLGALSIALIPLINLAILLIARRFYRTETTLLLFVSSLVIIVLGYVLGALIKFVLVLNYLKSEMIDAMGLNPISYPFEILALYDYAIIMAVVVALLFLLVIKWKGGKGN